MIPLHDPIKIGVCAFRSGNVAKEKIMAQGKLTDKDGDGIDDQYGKYPHGWAAFPPRGLWHGNDTDLQAGQTNGPNNGQISSAKLYASNGN
jgi:hypothetical protein